MAYTIETRNLRKHSTKQLKVLERQHTVAVAPYLLAGLCPKTEIINILKTNPSTLLDVPDEELALRAKQYLEELEKDTNNMYLCEISNPTSKIALNIELVIYDSTTKNFTLSDESLVAIGEQKSEHIIADLGPMTDKEAASTLKNNYLTDSSKLTELIKYEENSYLLVMFKDIEQGTYGIKREFSTDENGDCILHESSLIVF